MFTILTKQNCPHCVSAKQALTFKRQQYSEVVYETPSQIDEFKSKGFRTFPQVYHNDKHIGGNQELQMYLIENF